MTKEALVVQIDVRGVATVAINRPDVRNAFDENLIALLSEAFGRLTIDPEVRVIVLSSGGTTFCAGADIAWMQRAAAGSFEHNVVDAQRFATMMSAIDTCSKPVVARIQGAAYGGGVGLACAADIVVASDRARFCVSEAKLGILPAVIGPYLVNAVGLRQARRLALSCCVVDAGQALALGLAHEVVAESDLDAAIERCVVELLQSAPRAQGEIKQLFSGLSVGPVTDLVRELTAQTISRVRTGEEARAGFSAFAEKRKAPWVPA
jgi:methylglutaconyl-CoA hydratase